MDSPDQNKGNTMKSMARTLVVLVSALLFVSCSLKSSIVGKWQEIGGSETIEFFKDGTISLTSHGISLNGKYTFIEDDRIKVEFGGLGSIAGPILYRASISSGELTLNDSKGKTSKFARVKP
jgi:hypothetical protein